MSAGRQEQIKIMLTGRLHQLRVPQLA